MPTQTQSQPAADALGTTFDQAAENGQKSLAAFAHLHTRVFRDAMRFNAHLLDFARRRINADIEASDRLCRCDSMTDAAETMTKFYSDAFQDYADEAAAMIRSGAEIGAGSAEETLTEAQKLNGSH